MKIRASILPFAIVVVSRIASLVVAAEASTGKPPQDVPPNRWVIPERPTWQDVVANPGTLTEEQEAAARVEFVRRINEWRESLSKEQLAEYYRHESVLPGADDSWYDWRASATQFDLDAAQQARLERMGFVVTGKSDRQIFGAYVGEGPFFITSDTLINAYAVLLEDSLVRLEARRAVDLRRHLETVWRALPEWGNARNEDAANFASSLEHLRHVIGPALALLGSEATSDASPELRVAIDADVASVNAATSQTLPGWLRPLTPSFVAIDFTRMKPVGFYERNTLLASYYRAMRWLQAAPFRAVRDDELIAFVVLGDVVTERGVAGFFDGYSAFLGAPDKLSLAGAREILAEHGRALREHSRYEILKRARNEARRAGNWAGPNERLRAQAGAASDPLGEVVYTIFATHVTPDASLLGEIVALPEASDRLPGGLAMAGMLGFSDLIPNPARDDWEKRMGEIVKKHAEWRHDRLANPHFDGVSLAPRFFDALAELSEPPDSAAPAFFLRAEWRAKQCNTVLGAWAQWRAVWVLQTREVISFTGGSNPPPGFVEPVPEFYRRFAEVIETTRDTLERQGVLDSQTIDGAFDYLAMASFIGDSGLERTPVIPWSEMQSSPGGMTFFRRLLATSDDGKFLRRVLDGELAPAEWTMLRKRFEASADDLFHRRNVEKLVRSDLSASRDKTQRDEWNDLAQMTRRLHAMSEKQLRGVDWSNEEAEFIRHFGLRLAHVMLYEADSFSFPRDDAPRIAAVATNPNINRTLHVGIGRPDEIFVLYPWKGVPVLCRGAIIPYYEHASADRLDDAQWKNLLDAKPSPPTPEFLAPMYAQ